MGFMDDARARVRGRRQGETDAAGRGANPSAVSTRSITAPAKIAISATLPMNQSKYAMKSTTCP